MGGIAATRQITAVGAATRVPVLRTVKTHVDRILAELALRARVQLVVLAYETGMVRPGG